ncbi:MAG: hypothetical protein APF76_01460 [Desulfitibacter sp. BRH_c19]|nr:MAG: hypothetical protein APF76_01460 [Desulfitibacter sp. BRH_c19]
MQKEIYLDNSATTQVLPQIVDRMTEAMLKNYGNPSSLHRKGFESEKELKKTRSTLGDILKTGSSSIYFCSGGTEANNWAIKSTARRYKKRGNHLITTKIEHASVLHSFKELEEEGFEVTYLPVNDKGVISLEDLKGLLKEETILISIMHVNNEVGSIMPIEDIGKILRESKALFHVDAIQSFCKLDIWPEKWGIDLLSLSGHKIHGPKGIGALYINDKLNIPALIVGGEQEAGKRSGTENVQGIVGLGEAAKIIKGHGNSKIIQLKNSLLNGLKKISGVHFNGQPEDYHTPIINVWFQGVDKAEVLLHMCEEDGLFVSTGSACHSRHPKPSHVLKAIGAKNEALYGAIRLSIGHQNQEHEMEQAAAIIEKRVKELRQL